MTQKRSMKSALTLSMISLLLCVTMLIGTTFAWFTDSVTSENNIIKSGNLDVELYYQVEGQSDWTKVTETTNVFKENALWEPGHTEVVKLKVVNEGNLALKYQLGVNVASEIGSRNVNGEEFKLSKFIKFGVVDGEQNYTREQAIAAVDANATALKTPHYSQFISLLPQTATNSDNEDIVTLVVYMPTTVGNEANYGKGEAVPTINLGINLFATQVEFESDSFDDLYDKDAGEDKVYTVEELEQRYEFTYFQSISDVINGINSGAVTGGSDTKNNDTTTGLYWDESGKPCVVLLKDTTLAERLKPSKDMTINLGGKVLQSDPKDALCINVVGGNLIIDGRLEGSAVIKRSPVSTVGCIQVPASSTAESVTIIGGTYSATNEGGGNVATLNLKNKNCVTTVTDCNITAVTTNKIANGIVNDGITVVTDCNIRAYSNYNSSGGEYTSLSYAVWNTGSLTMKDCNAYGTHSAIASTGSLDIDGGTYEGFGHGGMYISGNGLTAYVRNATLKDSVTMPEGYTNTAAHNGVGIYIGGSDGNNSTVYMDNCDIYGSNHPIVLRGTSGEQNIRLYASNSTINTDRKIRIDNETHHLYIGFGNNFTADHTTLPVAVTQTNETYQ